LRVTLLTFFQKGRVSALRQLVKKPWTDGWDLARKLALDLVEEARQQAIKQVRTVVLLFVAKTSLKHIYSQPAVFFLYISGLF